VQFFEDFGDGMGGGRHAPILVQRVAVDLPSVLALSRVCPSPDSHPYTFGAPR
jgi:hypothetical protein